MSAIIQQARKRYRLAFLWEIGLLACVNLLLMIWRSDWAWAFGAGVVSALLPHLSFVYWIFFRKTSQFPHAMQAFYRGEGIKWGLTLLIVGSLFYWDKSLNYLLFFAGYFVTLIANNVIPFYLSRQSRK